MTASLSLILTSLALACCSNSALAFVQPRTFATSTISISSKNAFQSAATCTSSSPGSSPGSAAAAAVDQYQASSTSLQLMPDHHNLFSTASSIILSEDAEAIANADSGLQGVRTFFIAIAALGIGIAGLTYVTAAFIVPQAAARLEIDTKRLRPGLWEEYEAKLEVGETMVSRSDFLQELGNTMQPIIIQDFEDTANAKDFGKKSTSDEKGKKSTSEKTNKKSKKEEKKASRKANKKAKAKDQGKQNTSENTITLDSEEQWKD